jgi:AAA-like domain
MTENYEYQVGASLPPDAPSYVVRKADSDFYDALKAGKYCYVFNSRQMGKSSLKVRVMQRLLNEGVACSSIDISGQGSKDNVTQEQWYTGIVSKIVKDLQIAKPIEFRQTWWRDRNDISPVQKLDEFIEDVLLTSIPGHIVIFVDEIDSTLSLKFASEDFFALIRSCYNKRSENTAYKRLTFALLGVATPGDLIKDKTRTPFNIGEAIELDGFKIHDIEPLAKGLTGKVKNPQAVMQEVLAWTGGQPFLTQRVCELLGKALSVERQNFRSVDENHTIEFVKEIISNQIIDNWEANDKQEHLKTIRDRIIADEEVSVALLGLYQQILQQGKIIVDASPEQMRLRLTGLVVQQQGKLRVYNHIYENIFDLTWVENELDKLRSYADKFKAWQKSKYRDESCLLQGNSLLDALIWSESRKLSVLDYQFLSAGQNLEMRNIRYKLEIEQKRLEAEKLLQLSLIIRNQRLNKQIKFGGTILCSTMILLMMIFMLAADTSNRLIHSNKTNEELTQINNDQSQKNMNLLDGFQSFKSLNKAMQQELEASRSQLENTRQELLSLRNQRQQQIQETRNASNEKTKIDEHISNARKQLQNIKNELVATQRQVIFENSRYKQDKIDRELSCDYLNKYLIKQPFARDITAGERQRCSITISR